MTATPQSTESLPIHAFDFDGTLTHKDSFVAFLKYLTGPYRFYIICILKIGIFIAYLFHRDRGILKSLLLYSILGPISRTDLLEKIAHFARDTGLKLFRDDAYLYWHSLDRAKITVGIVTASPRLLVEAVSAPLNPDFVLGSELGFDDNDRLLPYLAGPNCRCEHKVAALNAHFGRVVALDSAYGDTKGDHDMLMIAQNRYFRFFVGKPLL